MRRTGIPNKQGMRMLEISPEQLSRLEDALQLKVVVLRHIRRMKWYEVSELLHYSPRQLHRVHRDALIRMGLRPEPAEGADTA